MSSNFGYFDGPSIPVTALQYADVADIVKMLNLQGGGSFMDNVNEAQKLVDLPDADGKRRKSATRAD